MISDVGEVMEMLDNERSSFSRTLAGILRGWDMTIERNEEQHL